MYDITNLFNVMDKKNFLPKLYASNILLPTPRTLVKIINTRLVESNRILIYVAGLQILT